MAVLPFTRGEFFEVFTAYNGETWPAAILAYPLALAALVGGWRATPASGRSAAMILGGMWAWVGVVYHGIYFSQINPAAVGFAAAFVLQALLLLGHAVLGRDFQSGPPERLRFNAGAIMIVYAMVAYPLIGLATGERYPAMPLFGVAPCSLLIFTLGLMLWATQTRWWLWIVPLGWSLIGGSAAIFLSVPQDWALPASAIAALCLLEISRRTRDKVYFGVLESHSVTADQI